MILYYIILHYITEAAPPWEQRDRRLLVAPMRITNRLRKQYLEVLPPKQTQQLFSKAHNIIN